MNINSKYHGEIEVNEEKILFFEKGIPGFQEEKKFIILPLSDDQVFSVLQSVESHYLAFVITNPFVFNKEYDFELDTSVIEELDIASEQDVQVYSILTVQDPFEKTTANLQAPIILNVKNKKGKQVILNNSQYTTKQPIFQLVKKG
ncbi:flagellar assembly protein FliW [Neobacillus sp. D3-1R]|uniref:flagellar assembly protein FliW n=1 Tax=Neobacillus sp. D3-1R TaxID=3445778 RepID=UPI003FA172C3